MINFEGFFQCNLLNLATPIEYLKLLSEYLGGPEIFVKREDTNTIGGCGNKLRKLEFILGDALKNGADTLITIGALQSNHARLTAAVAAKFGLGCHLILAPKVAQYGDDYTKNGNLLLNNIFGAKVHLLDKDANIENYVEELKLKLQNSGLNPYYIPMGGSNAIGGLGYMKCADEISVYSDTHGKSFDYITVANGSSGTHAGLIAGFKVLKYPAKTIGYNVLKPTSEILPQTLNIANQSIRLIDPNLEIAAKDIILDDNHLGDGYGIPNNEMKEAVCLMGKLEGLLLDPVYTGKAFAGVISDIKSGKFKKTDRILFIMTGGAVGIHAYQNVFGSVIS